MEIEIKYKTISVTMIYNIALTIEDEFLDKAIEIYENLGLNLKTKFRVGKDSKLHATIVKFESNNELKISELKELIKDLNQNILITIYQVRALPSNENPIWIELSLELTDELKKLHLKLLERTNKFKIINRVRKQYRPHITLARTLKDRVNNVIPITRTLDEFRIKSKLNVIISEPEYKILT